MRTPTSLAEAIRKVRQREATQLVLKQWPVIQAGANHQENQKPKAKVASASSKSESHETSVSSDMSKVLELLTKMDQTITALEQKATIPNNSGDGCQNCRSWGREPHRAGDCPAV